MSTNPSSASGANEFSGKTVEEATADGLRAMGLRAEDASVEIVHRGSRGLFGIGSEPAVVRIRRAADTADAAARPTATQAAAAESTATAHVAPAVESVAKPIQEPVAPPPAAQAPATRPARAVEPTTEEATGAVAAGDVDADGPSPERDSQVAALAGEMLQKIITLMGFEARVDTQWREADAITDDRHLLLSAHGPNLSGLIGRRGETLENLQYLLRLMVNQKMHRWLNIIVDVEDFRAKRVEHLTKLAQRMAEQVAETKRSFALEPMPPNERRIVHLALRDHDLVFTESTGEGERRKVTIFPKQP